MTIGITEKSFVPAAWIMHQDLSIKRMLRLQRPCGRLAGLRLEIAQKFDPKRGCPAQTMDRHLRVCQSIETLLLNPLVQGGVAQLQAKLNSIELQAAVAVADGNRTVVEPLKERGIGLMPAGVTLIGGEP